MFSDRIEDLIEIAIADGDLTPRKKELLLKHAADEGLDIDEFQMIIDFRVKKKRKDLELSGAPVPPPPVPPTPPQTPQIPQSATESRHGTVKKCPSCAAPVQPGSIKCEECGHTFSDIAVSSSRVRFANTLLEIDTKYNQLEGERKRNNNQKGFLQNIASQLLDEDYSMDRFQEKKTFIETFPIPNSKEDLIDFLCFMKSKGCLSEKKSAFKTFMRVDQTEAKEYDDLFPIYKMKYEECLSKASLFLKDDPQFATLLEQNGITIGQPNKKKFGLF